MRSSAVSRALDPSAIPSIARPNRSRLTQHHDWRRIVSDYCIVPRVFVARNKAGNRSTWHAEVRQLRRRGCKEYAVATEGQQLPIRSRGWLVVFALAESGHDPTQRDWSASSSLPISQGHVRRLLDAVRELPKVCPICTCRSVWVHEY